MGLEQEYDLVMRRLLSASVAGLALVALALIVAPESAAQVHGVPASVTSQNFGGHYNPTPGVAPSVTSLGPHGYAPPNHLFHGPGCCINPLFPSNPNRPGSSHRHRGNRSFYSHGAVYAVPYYYSPAEEEETSDTQNVEPPADEYRGGPTIFDRRGPGTYPPPAGEYSDSEQGEANAQAPNAPVTPAAAPQAPEDRPQTLLVFRDGHQLEVQNYAIVGSTLYDLTPGRNHKIALADLDLAATAKQNNDRGIDFEMPKAHSAN